MKGNALPNAKQRRELLAADSAQLPAVGRNLWQAGRWGEAMECLAACQDPEGLARALEDSFQAGDLFYWRQVMEALGRKAAGAELSQLMQNARSQGKELFSSATQALLHRPEEPSKT